MLVECSDSFFLAPLPYDPFTRLRDLGGAYGYLSTGREEGKFSVGLWDAFVAAANAEGLHQPGLYVPMHLLQDSQN